MESKPQVLTLSPEGTVAMLQKLLQEKNKDCMVVMISVDEEEPIFDFTYISNTPLGLYHKIMREYDLENRIKTAIEGLNSDINPSKYFKSFYHEEFPTQYRGGSFHYGTIVFASKEDLDQFIAVAQAEVAKVIAKY